MSSLSILKLHPAFELYNRHRDLEISRSFICSILWEAYDRDDQERIEEFTAKLAAVDKEIETLIAQA